MGKTRAKWARRYDVALEKEGVDLDTRIRAKERVIGEMESELAALRASEHAPESEAVV